jgi:hypothetical protein
MNEIRHTPGPWMVNRDAEYCGSRIDGPDGRAVAHATQRDPHPTIGHGISQEQAEINGRLIAAAPDLLEALQYALPYLEACVPNPRNGVNADYSTDTNCVDRARAAIAKATGSQS